MEGVKNKGLREGGGIINENKRSDEKIEKIVTNRTTKGGSI